jgi:hypothetical protein
MLLSSCLANLAAADAEGLWGWIMDELVTAKRRPVLLRGFIRQTSSKAAFRGDAASMIPAADGT